MSLVRRSRPRLKKLETVEVKVTPTTTQPEALPDLVRVNGEWFFLDETGSEIGPYATEEQTLTAFRAYLKSL